MNINLPQVIVIAAGNRFTVTNGDMCERISTGVKKNDLSFVIDTTRTRSATGIFSQFQQYFNLLIYTAKTTGHTRKPYKQLILVFIVLLTEKHANRNTQ